MRGPLTGRARLALWVLGLDALAALGLAAFVLTSHRPGQGDWLTAGDAVAGALLQGVWTLLLYSLFRDEAADGWNGWFMAYRALFPLLLAWRGLLFALTLFGVLGGLEGSGVVAWLLLFVAWGGGLFASLAVYSLSVRLLQEPGEAGTRQHLGRWLEWSAIFGAAMTVMNVYPPNGLTRPDGVEMLVWGLSGALDVAALLLLRRALTDVPQPAV